MMKKILTSYNIILNISPKFLKFFKFKFLNFYYSQNIDNSIAKKHFKWKPKNDFEHS